MEISLIAAIGKNNELGKNNQLIWRIPEDLAFFKEKTMGNTIVMGRKTFESLPRRLPGRRHVVLSRGVPDFPDDIVTYSSLQELFECEAEDFFVIGGAQIYQSFLEYATRMYLTEIDAIDIEADAYFPNFNKTLWQEKTLSEYQQPISYKHVEYVKKKK